MPNRKTEQEFAPDVVAQPQGGRVGPGLYGAGCHAARPHALARTGEQCAGAAQGAAVSPVGPVGPGAKATGKTAALCAVPGTGLCAPLADETRPMASDPRQAKTRLGPAAWAIGT